MGGVCGKSTAGIDLLRKGQSSLIEAEQYQQQHKLFEAVTAFQKAINCFELLDNSAEKQIQLLLIRAHLGQGDTLKVLNEIDKSRLSYQKAQQLGSIEARSKIKDLIENLSIHNQISPILSQPASVFTNSPSPNQVISLQSSNFSTSPAVTTRASTPPLVIKYNPASQNLNVKISTDPKEIKDTRELAESILKIDRQSHNYLILQRLALQVINEFGHLKVKTAELIEEVIELAKANDEKLTHELLAQCIDSIVNSQLLNISLIDGLAKILHWSNPATFSKDDLVKSLSVVTGRLMQIHRQLASEENEEAHYRFLSALGRLLDALVDIGVQGLSREKQHELLYDALGNYTEGRLGFQAQYCRQSLVRVPNDESRWSMYIRKGKAAGQGLSAIWTAIKGLDPVPLLTAYENLTLVVKTQESTQNWYDALRYAELLIEANHWLGFEHFIKNSSDKNAPAFLLGIIQLLDKTISNHTEIVVRKQALNLLGQFFSHFEYWKSDKNHWEKLKLKIWDTPEGFLKPVLGKIQEYSLEPNEEIRQEALQLLGQFQGNNHLTAHQLTLLNQLSSFAQIRQDKARENFSTQLLNASQKDKHLQIDIDKIIKTTKETQEIAIETRIFVKKVDANLIEQKINAEQVLMKVQDTHAMVQTLALTNDVEKSVLEKLNQLRQRILNNQLIENELVTYIPANGINKLSDTSPFDLEKAVTIFLNNEDKKVLLLRGFAGAGKSTFNLYLERQLWKTYQIGNTIPLLISLPSLQHVEGNMIREHLQRQGFLDNEIEFLKKKHQFTFILDGYDEINKFVNLYQKNHLELWQAKVLIACRSNYLDKLAGNYTIYFMPYLQDKPQPSELIDFIVAPFTDEQIESYVQKYLKVCKINTKGSQWTNAERYLQSFDEIPGLRQLIRTPFLLMVTMDIMPCIIDQYKGHTKNKQILITQAKMLDEFVQQLFEREENKLLIEGRLPADGHDIKQDFWEFAMELAVAMCEAEVLQVRYAPSSNLFTKTKTNAWEQFFGIPLNKENAEQLAIARNGCMSVLRTLEKNCYSFIHPILRDYFKGRKIKEEELLDEEEELRLQSSHPILAPTQSNITSNQIGGMYFDWTRPTNSNFPNQSNNSVEKIATMKHK